SRACFSHAWDSDLGSRHGAISYSGGRATAQTSPLQHAWVPRRVEVGVGAVKQAAVVPHQQVARHPLVAVDETLLHRVLNELLQTNAPDLLGLPFEVRGVLAHEERLAPGFRDRADERMRHGRGVCDFLRRGLSPGARPGNLPAVHDADAVEL